MPAESWAGGSAAAPEAEATDARVDGQTGARLDLSVVCDALAIVRPDMRRSCACIERVFEPYWRWKSRLRPGRRAVSLEIRQLIRKISIANPVWGAPRLHGELLKDRDR